jgi:hypothetical protein
MSVNLHLSLKVSGYEPSRQKEIKQAIQDILAQEEIDNDMSPLAEIGEGPDRTLESHSDPEFPLIISGSYKWLPQVQKELENAVAKANGEPCHVEFEGMDADEDLDDEEEDEDEEEDS